MNITTYRVLRRSRLAVLEKDVTDTLNDSRKDYQLVGGIATVINSHGVLLYMQAITETRPERLIADLSWVAEGVGISGSGESGISDRELASKLKGPKKPKQPTADLTWSPKGAGRGKRKR